MADDDDDGQSNRRTSRSGSRVTPTTPDRAMRRSQETGESSQTGILRRIATPSTATTDRSRDASGSDTMDFGSSPADHQQGGASLRVRRRTKGRSTGGFLLQAAVAPGEEHSNRRRARSLLHPKAKAVPQTPDRPRQTTGNDQEPHFRHSTTTPVARHDEGRPSPTPERSTEDNTMGPSSGSSRGAVLDVDATQIVSMALSLGESRGVASRRYGHRPNPPRLAPLPDSASKSNLRQHFQQQRRTSLTGSPRLSQGTSPRIPSGFRSRSPRHAPQGTGHEGSYQYQFSAATLARAQKAKEHLELMAEYRRLLTSLPPLKPEHNQPSGGTPGSPRFGAQGASSTKKGGQLIATRPYNPLQYVRNRKVRARERKVIDGELMGFGDIESVRDWVNRITESGYTGGCGTDDTFSMPQFSSNQADDQQGSPDPRQAMRVKRPRVDWFIDPCDLIADAYWLEQDSHKHLIEDRFWRKIFPPLAQDAPQTTSGNIGDTGQKTIPLWLTETEPHDKTYDLHLDQTDEIIEGRRDRARQKVHELRPFHHRHNSSMQGTHNLLRSKGGSISDHSGSDSEQRPELKRSRTKGGRRETITSDTSDLLQKQMDHVMAQEEQEAEELANVAETEAEYKFAEQGSPSPGNVPSGSGITSSYNHSRKTSVADFSDSDIRLNGIRAQLESTPGYKRGRQSLEASEYPRRDSSTNNHSTPASPQVEQEKQIISPTKVNQNFSVASSRSGSPSRNPLSKIKKKLKDRSRENGDDSHSDADEDTKRQGALVPEPPSPSENPAMRHTDDSYRTHRSTNSMRLRADDQGNGLRGLFKGGPRIDTVFRGGVSKIGDMFWKKESNETQFGGDTSDESDDDNGTDRSKQSLTLSRRQSRRMQEDSQRPGARHFLDSMPEFHHVGEPSKRSSVQNRPAASDISRPVSRQSARWEQLRPPRIDVRDASTTAPPSMVSERGESDVSPTEHDHGREVNEFGGVDKTLQNLMASQMLDPRNTPQGRHWSIHDHGPSPERTRLSKREISRVRALILSSGIKAMEISRRAHEEQKPFSHEHLALTSEDPRSKVGGVTWAFIATLTPDASEFQEQSVAACDIYPLASRALGTAIQASGQRWQMSADKFSSDTAPKLQEHIRRVRSRLTDDLSQMTRHAADEADETSKQLALDQPLKVKHVVDTIENLMRNRRRRFRYVRRGLWLAVEWTLVGFMWYVWFMVMIIRVFLGVGRGVLSGARWLLWL